MANREVSQGWGTEVRLPVPAACIAFLEGVRALLRECLGRLALLDRKPIPLDADVAALIMAEEDRLRRLREMLSEPFSFADQTAWRRTRSACDVLSELGDRPAVDVVGHWYLTRGRQVFADAEESVAETMSWLKGLA